MKCHGDRRHPGFRIVVSSDSMKNATATSHGTSHLADLANEESGAGAAVTAG